MIIFIDILSQQFYTSTSFELKKVLHDLKINTEEQGNETS